ncbi:uncharacterized protein LOC122393723 [Amphibalanus amphitrite]|uniref:uncharacterized protein LOC122393723 n=1 Tax=Amphibalanus amphitrite TaxID=1232801 RepID=UPI001C9011B3|nr:uncharacterized protein LOC122393723 [Amphibalanus amphitrite]
MAGYQVNIEDAGNYSELNETEKRRVRQQVLREPAVRESVEEMKQRLNLMKSIVDDTRQVMSGGAAEPRPKGVAIDGAMMGAIFAVILAVILGASAHAFQNLYYAVLKRFNR